MVHSQGLMSCKLTVCCHGNEKFCVSLPNFIACIHWRVTDFKEVIVMYSSVVDFTWLITVVLLDVRVAVLVRSDGTFWHPMVSKSDKLYIFNSDLCRSLYITCDDGTESVVSGVTTYHFTPPPAVFASPHQNPDNSGFCTPADNCLLAGVLNVTLCRGMVLYHTVCRACLWEHEWSLTLLLVLVCCTNHH